MCLPVERPCQLHEEPEVQKTPGQVGCVVTCLKGEERGGPGQPSPPPHERTPESIQLPGRLQLRQQWQPLTPPALQPSAPPVWSSKKEWGVGHRADSSVC
ncbi:unnamed protein product [Lota lota]